MQSVVQDISLLCRGEPSKLEGWLRTGRRKLVTSLVFIVVCGAFYGFAIGILRSPVQALYTAIKFPILILAIVLCNGLLNGMLAMLLGIRLNIMESVRAILMSYAIACVVLASLGPVFFFHLWNWSAGDAGNAFFYWKLFHIGMIALAGIIGNVRLWQLLKQVAGRVKAGAVLFSWLVANLFLGCQLSWIMRPFFGNPNIEVSFLRSDALDRSFYEDVWMIVQGFLQ
jgi:hypothetical protein